MTDDTNTIAVTLTLNIPRDNMQGSDREGWYCYETGDEYDSLKELIQDQFRKSLRAFSVSNLAIVPPDPVKPNLRWEKWGKSWHVGTKVGGEWIHYYNVAPSSSGRYWADRFVTTGQSYVMRICPTLAAAVGQVIVWAAEGGHNLAPFPTPQILNDNLDT